MTRQIYEYDMQTSHQALDWCFNNDPNQKYDVKGTWLLPLVHLELLISHLECILWLLWCCPLGIGSKFHTSTLVHEFLTKNSKNIINQALHSPDMILSFFSSHQKVPTRSVLKNGLFNGIILPYQVETILKAKIMFDD